MYLLLLHEISGQPTNTHKTDSTGIYFYSLDSLMELVLSIDKFDKMLIHIPHRRMDSNFNKISNREVIVYSNISTMRLKKNELRVNNLLIEDFPVLINGDIIESAFAVLKRMNGDYNMYGNGFYSLILFCCSLLR